MLSDNIELNMDSDKINTLVCLSRIIFIEGEFLQEAK